MWTTSIPPGDHGVFSLASATTESFSSLEVSGAAPYLLDAETGVILKRYGWAGCELKK